MAQLVRDDILANHELRGGEFCRAYTERVDRWLRQLFVTATGAPDRVALVAVGSYGRGELCPQSDLDVLLVHDRRVDVATLAERLWYPMWDTGVKLGHAVFTPKEALKLAETELDTATALLDARHVAGDESLTADLLAAAKAQWVRGASKWLPLLRDALVQRTVNPGEVAFVLEPDLKLGRGGLRDAHVLRWLEAAQPGLMDGDRATYDAAFEQLLATRVSLHRRSGRRGDLLLLQEQDSVAEDLGFLDADALMASVAGAARRIEWLTDDAFDRVLLSGTRFRRRPRDRSLGGGLAVRDGQVHMIEAVAEGTAGCVQLLDAAVAAAKVELRLARDTLERFAASVTSFPSPWPDVVRDRFVALLRCGAPAIPVLELLDHWGLLVRAIPEWEPCRSRPQRNAYHRYTVDRHLLEAAANGAALVDRVDRPDLLVMGCLLHDIGKGYPPHDHTEIGCRIVESLGPRLGYPPEDVAVLVDLVRLHLLLPDVATRRDLSDDGTIRAVAAAVGTQERLRLLHALTEADSIATGPAAWGDWKAGLLSELVARTNHLLGGDPATVAETFPSEAHRQLMALGHRVVQAAGTTVTVVDPDRLGLLSRVAGVLALNGLDVLAANAHSDDAGVALCEFTVVNTLAGDSAIHWDKVHSDIERALAGRLAVRARLAERAHVYGRGRSTKPSPVPWDRTATSHSVQIDNEMSAGATVLEVRAPNSVGLLYRITSTMAELDLDIRSAKIQTLGDHVVDAFYVRDSSGAKLTDKAHLSEIERALLFALLG